MPIRPSYSIALCPDQVRRLDRLLSTLVTPDLVDAATIREARAGLAVHIKEMDDDRRPNEVCQRLYYLRTIYQARAAGAKNVSYLPGANPMPGMRPVDAENLSLLAGLIERQHLDLAKNFVNRLDLEVRREILGHIPEIVTLLNP
jgi:hypothetical protein